MHEPYWTPKINMEENCNGHVECWYRGIYTNVIVYIFAHLHRALLTEINKLDMNSLQAAKRLVKLKTC